LKFLISILCLLFSLLGIWISSGIRFRRAKKAFETELLKKELPNEAVDLLATSYSDIKKEFFNILIRGVRYVANRRSFF
jgi:hypothetical protein